MKMNFVEGSSNGLLISKELFKKTGGFTEAKMYKQGTNSFELAKMLWAMNAMKHGSTFKGIVGLRIV